MNELLGLPSRVLVAVIDGGVGIDDALCDREQVAFLGECTVGIGISYRPTNMRCLSWLISTKVAGELNSGMMSPAGFP